jgi:transposase
MMFKALVIQAANNLSDERTEFLINDSLSFMWFLRLGLSDRVPDARTIWLFREKLTKAEAIKPLFCAVRSGAARRRLHRHGRADRRRLADRCAETAQYRGREEDDQRGPNS